VKEMRRGFVESCATSSRLVLVLDPHHKTLNMKTYTPNYSSVQLPGAMSDRLLTQENPNPTRSELIPKNGGKRPTCSTLGMMTQQPLHFSDQPELFLSMKPPNHALRIPQKVLTLR